MTRCLVDTFMQRENLSVTARTLHAQTICVFSESPHHLLGVIFFPGIAWSAQPDFGMAPAPLLDGSLFIAGNRAGALNFMR